MTNLAITSCRLMIVQRQRLVITVEARDSEAQRSPVGPSRFVCLHGGTGRMGYRDLFCPLPLHVLVPVAAGGDRDEHKKTRDSLTAAGVPKEHPGGGRDRPLCPAGRQTGLP